MRTRPRQPHRHRKFERDELAGGGKKGGGGKWAYLVERGRDHQVLLRVEGGAHDVVVVAGQDMDALARLPVPNANGLVVRSRQNPRVPVQGGRPKQQKHGQINFAKPIKKTTSDRRPQPSNARNRPQQPHRKTTRQQDNKTAKTNALVVELDGPDVVQVPHQGEEALALLVVPDLDLVVVAARHKQRLRLVKLHPADRALVFVKPVEQGPHAVVPQLRRRVRWGKGRGVRVTRVKVRRRWDNGKPPPWCCNDANHTHTSSACKSPEE